MSIASPALAKRGIADVALTWATSFPVLAGLVRADL
jgi:hypothetical protein